MQFFVNNRQKNWPEWLATARFAINNKTYLVTKMSLFMENYGREMRIGVNIRKKRKVEKATEFVKKIKKVQEKVRAVLRKVQKEMKRQADRK